MSSNINMSSNISKAVFFTILVIVIVLISCYQNIRNTEPLDYENARRATISAWEKIIGKVSDNCYYFTEDTSLAEAENLPDECLAEPNMVVIGCYFKKSNSIFILNSLSKYKKLDTAVHEYIHALSYCMFGYSDHDHENPFLWDEFGESTVEIWGCAGL